MTPSPSSNVDRGVSRSGRAIPLVLAACAFVFAFVFAQRPGKVFADSRVELTGRSGAFPPPTPPRSGAPPTDLGHVQSAQFVGYLFPKGPWFALARVGLPMWVAERLLMGALLALAAWGLVLVMDDLFGRKRGVAHVAAGAPVRGESLRGHGSGARAHRLPARVRRPCHGCWSRRIAGYASPEGWLWPGFALVIAASGAG